MPDSDFYSVAVEQEACTGQALRQWQSRTSHVNHATTGCVSISPFPVLLHMHELTHPYLLPAVPHEVINHAQLI